MTLRHSNHYRLTNREQTAGLQILLGGNNTTRTVSWMIES